MPVYHAMRQGPGPGPGAGGGLDKITRCHSLLTQHIDCVHLAIDGFSALDFAFDRDRFFEVNIQKSLLPVSISPSAP